MKFLYMLCVLIGLGNSAFSAAAAASQLGRLSMDPDSYSFSAFLKSHEGQKALKELETTGLSFKDPAGHLVFLHAYPACFKSNQAFSFSDLGQELFAKGGSDPFHGYHENGDHWQKEKLASIFLGASAANIIEEYVGKKDGFPSITITVWANIPAFNSLEEALNLPFKAEEGQVLSVTIDQWWEAYKQKKSSFSQSNKTKVFIKKIQEVLNPEAELQTRVVGHLAEDLRTRFVKGVLEEISRNEPLLDFGILYQRLKVVEEKNPQNKKLTALLDSVQDVMSYWVDQTFKYAVLHIMLGQPIEGAARDAEIELLHTLPPSLHPHFLMGEAQKFFKS